MVLEGVPGGSGSVRYGRVLVFCRAAYYIIKKVIRFGTKSQHTGRGGSLVRRASHSQRAALHETPSVSGPCGRGPRATSGTVRGRVLGRSAGARSAGRRALAEVALCALCPLCPRPAARGRPAGAAGRRCAAARVAVDRRRALRDPRALRAHRAQATGKRRMLASSMPCLLVRGGAHAYLSHTHPHSPHRTNLGRAGGRRRAGGVAVTCVLVTFGTLPFTHGVLACGMRRLAPACR